MTCPPRLFDFHIANCDYVIKSMNTKGDEVTIEGINSENNFHHTKHFEIGDFMNFEEPSLEELSNAFRIPHDVAAATFLVLGGSAPEITISCFIVYRGKVDISLGAILGAIIAFSVIPGLLSPFYYFS